MTPMTDTGADDVGVPVRTTDRPPGPTLELSGLSAWYGEARVLTDVDL